MDFSNKESKPLFSILIPAYNVGKLIRRCLFTVLNQTYSNIEVIIVDDASTDNTFDVISEYSKHDKRIKVIRNEKNESLEYSRTVAMEMCKGDYIIFVDSDDYISLDICETLFRELSIEKSDIIEYSYAIDPYNMVVSQHHDDYTVEGILTLKYYHTIWNKCYSRELIKKSLKAIKKFYCNMSEDIYFATVFSHFAESYRIIDAVLYHYVRGDGMTSNGIFTKQTVQNALISIKNRAIYSKQFFDEYASQYNSLINDSVKSDCEFLMSMCAVSKNKRINKVRRIKDILSFCNEFESKKSSHIAEYVEAFNIYCTIITNNRKAMKNQS